MNPEPTNLNEKFSVFSLAVMEDSGTDNFLLT